MEKAIGKKTLLGVVAPMAALYVASVPLALANNWYRVAPWVDAPIHFIITTVVIFLFLWYLDNFHKNFKYQHSTFLTIIVALGMAGSGGVFWEFIEFIYDEVQHLINSGAPATQFHVRDTIWDLFFDMLGGVFVVLYVRIRYYIKKKKS